MDLKTAFLQDEAYDQNRDIICQIPPEMGYPPHVGARMNNPAYGLNDAPRRWWNILDSALRSYGLVPTRADRCTYVYYGKQLPTSLPISEKKSSNTFDLEGAVDYLMDPVSGNNAKNRQVHGALSLHVDDLLCLLCLFHQGNALYTSFAPSFSYLCSFLCAPLLGCWGGAANL